MRWLPLLLLAACSKPADFAPPTRPDAAPDVGVADAGLLPDFELPDFEVEPVADFGVAGAVEGTLLEAAEDFEGVTGFFFRNERTGEALAHQPDVPVDSGSLARMWVAVAFARQVDLELLDPRAEIALEAGGLRGGKLNESHVGERYTAANLAGRMILDSDRTAEELLVTLLGGAAEVDAGLAAIGVSGFGRYLAPCEADRDYALRLDRRFSEVDCQTLAEWLRTRQRFLIPFDYEADAEREAEVRAQLLEEGTFAGTARAWAHLMAKLNARALGSPSTADKLLPILERSLGDGGGADALPPEAWSSSVQGRGRAGRSWAGIVRGEGDDFLAVMLTDQHERETQPLFRAAAGEAFEQLVGDPVVWPPAPMARPEWLEEVLLVDEGEAGNCEATGGNYEGVLACRREHRRAGFVEGANAGLSLFLRKSPPLRIAWFWQDPEGLRRRFQVLLGPSGWWIWTRTLSVAPVGPWRAALYFEGVPYYLVEFPVR